MKESYLEKYLRQFVSYFCFVSYGLVTNKIIFLSLGKNKSKYTEKGNAY